jgi:polysaccharide deacetylase 2 family uncharacterized protein YibQ
MAGGDDTGAVAPPAASPRHPGWTWLLRLWGLVILGLASGGAGLAWLGPPAPAESSVAEAPTPPGGAAAEPAALLHGLAEPALVELSRQGPLPRVGAEGRTSIRAYGRPFERGDTRPRAAVVIGNLGLSEVFARNAIERLPAETGLALSPYAEDPLAVARLARGRGMEVLMGLPLEPAGFPLQDPGERALLTTQPWSANLERLEWALSRGLAYVGVVGALGPMRGERFAAQPDTLQRLQLAVAGRGLLYLDPRPGAPAPQWAWGRTADVILDDPPDRNALDRALGRLERLARQQGSALGYAGDASPFVVEMVALWAAGLEGRGVALAPPSALIRRPEGIPRESAQR